MAEAIFLGTASIRWSNNKYDWLGSGAYFWEADPARALQWAQEQYERGKISEPAVVGAIIDLRNCLNLSSIEGMTYLSAAFESYKTLRSIEGQPLPENTSLSGEAENDKLLRKLDNAVVQHLHEIVAGQSEIEPFDSVRCMFIEGDEVYPGASFRVKSHVQIAVRNELCIIGYFRPIGL